jgi:hypothetical protein
MVILSLPGYAKPRVAPKHRIRARSDSQRPCLAKKCRLLLSRPGRDAELAGTGAAGRQAGAGHCRADGSIFLAGGDHEMHGPVRYGV